MRRRSLPSAQPAPSAFTPRHAFRAPRPGRPAAFVALAALASLVGCGGAPPPGAEASPATRPAPIAAPPRGDDGEAARAAAATLDAWHEAASRSDEVAYFDLFDDDGVFLGTDTTERWDKAALRAYAKKPFSEGRGWSFRATRRALDVSPDGELAYFDEDLASPKFPPTRGSGVLVRRGGSWKIRQYVLSMTIPNDRFDAVKRDATAPVALAAEGDLAPLAWLAGTWASDDRSIELTWSQARAGTMVGTLRVVTGSDAKRAETQSIDALRIEAGEQGATYTAERKGRAALRYEMEPERETTSKPPAASSSTPVTARVTFVDTPNQVRLTFSRDAEGLRIVVERKGKIEETTLLRSAVAGEL